MSPDFRDKVLSVAKGALIAGAGALLTYALDAVNTVPLGPWAPIVTAILSVVVNAVRKVAV